VVAVDAYRESLDRFLAERKEEEYRQRAGLQPHLELEPIYDRHAELFSLESAAALSAHAGEDRRVRELWRFACEGYVGRAAADIDERIAGLESALAARADGASVPLRAVGARLANEPDRARRERLELARDELLVDSMNPVLLEAAAARQRAVRELGAASTLDLYRRLGFSLDDLGRQCEAVLDETERLYEQSVDKLFRTRTGLSLEQAERWDVPRVFRAPDWDPAFPAAGMLPALEGTLRELGLELRSQRNLVLDLEPRPGKAARSFCEAIEVPGRVVLVLSPVGGFFDWRNLFHEAGHAEHLANTSPDLPVEYRRLGDDAVTEGWASLFESLVTDPGWLSRRLDVPRPWDLGAEAAAEDLFTLRWLSAKLLYELEFHASDEPESMATRWVELLAEALKITPSPADYLVRIDPGFYVAAYLRSLAFAAQLRLFLREELGSSWFARRETGSLLHDLWSEGQRLTADELLKDVAGMTLDLGAAVERIADAL
jgi:hypothetical protein